MLRVATFLSTSKRPAANVGKILLTFSHTRLDHRQSLLSDLDRIDRRLDASGMMDAMDRFPQQAVGILTSGRFAAAMDLSREDPQTLARSWGSKSTSGIRSTTSEGPDSVRKFLLAR